MSRGKKEILYSFIKENPDYLQETETDTVLILGTFHEVKSNLAKYEQEDVEVQRE